MKKKLVIITCVIFIILITTLIVLSTFNTSFESQTYDKKIRTEVFKSDFNGDGINEILKVEIKYWYIEVSEDIDDDIGLRYETLIFLNNKIISKDYSIHPQDAIDIVDYNNDGINEIEIIHKILPPSGWGFRNDICKINSNIELLSSDIIIESSYNYEHIREKYYNSLYKFLTD